jgi:hypothetical protein
MISGNNLQSDSATNVQTFFSQKEKAIIDYVTKNPGVTKQTVVDALDGKYSRVIVFDIIKELEKYEIITIRKNKPNSQIHNLYLSESNPILKEAERLSRFTSVIMNLFEKIKDLDVKAGSQYADYIEEYFVRSKRADEEKKFNPLKFLESSSGYQQLRLCGDMYLELFQIFWRMIQVYAIQVSFVWPFQIENKHVVSRLIHAVVEKLADIQVRMAQIVYDTKAPGIQKGGIHLMIVATLLKETNISSQISKKGVKNFQRVGLSKEVEDLSSSLSDITHSMHMNSHSLPNPYVHTEEEHSMFQRSMLKAYKEGLQIEGQQHSTPDARNETLPKKKKKPV